MQHAGLMEVARRDPRFAYEAYEFIFAALEHTQQLLARPESQSPKSEEPVAHHVSGPELVRGACDLAIQDFGRLARVVWQMWGVNSTDDLGAIVFNLIDANLLTKTDRDTRDEFHALFDLDDVLRKDVEIRLEYKDVP